jgi:hypothetical protein
MLFGHTFNSYIEAAYHAGIISGCPDHTLHPQAEITRGQLSKLIVGAAGWPVDTSGGPHFTDVLPGSMFYEHVERTELTSGWGTRPRAGRSPRSSGYLWAALRQRQTI